MCSEGRKKKKSVSAAGRVWNGPGWSGGWGWGCEGGGATGCVLTGGDRTPRRQTGLLSAAQGFIFTQHHVTPCGYVTVAAFNH